MNEIVKRGLGGWLILVGILLVLTISQYCYSSPLIKTGNYDKAEMMKEFVDITIDEIGLSGQVKVKDLIKLYDNNTEYQELINQYIGGMESAFMLANSKLEKKLYCQPKRLALTHVQSFKIFRDEVKRNGFYDEFPGQASMAIIFLEGLQYVFPCN